MISLLQVNSGNNNRAQHMNRVWRVRTCICEIIVAAGLWILVLLELLNMSKLYSNCLTYKVLHPDCIKKKQAFVNFWWICGLVWGREVFLPLANTTASSISAVSTLKEWKWVILALVALQACLQILYTQTMVATNPLKLWV